MFPGDARRRASGAGVAAGSFVEGVTRDGQGPPLAGVLVTLRAAAGRIAGEAMIGADGRYRFTGLATGIYAI